VLSAKLKKEIMKGWAEMSSFLSMTAAAMTATMSAAAGMAH
jgi:hypothetical protein